MTTLARTLAALALTWTATVGPLVSPARGDGENLADAVRAFKAEKLREIDEATAELRDLIAEKARALEAMEAELRDAKAELGHLEAFKATLDAPASAAPAVIPGMLDAVVPASAVEATEREWEGTIRIVASTDGKLAIVHESIDGSGAVGAGALQGDLIEISVTSAEDASVIAQALRADGKPVVTWPFRNVGVGQPASPEPDGRIESLEQTLERLAEAVDRIDKRTSSPVPSAKADDAPGPLPSAPTIPD